MDLNASPLPEEDDSVRSDTVRYQFSGRERGTGFETMNQVLVCYLSFYYTYA